MARVPVLINCRKLAKTADANKKLEAVRVTHLKISLAEAPNSHHE